MRHILVTGAAGFIGSHTVDRLLSDGFTVTGVDNFDPFYSRCLKEENTKPHRQHSRYRMVERDIRDLDGLIVDLDDHYDGIVHLAAKAGVRPSIDTPGIYQDVNVRGTQNLLELARMLNVPQFVFASSSSVYGLNPRVPWQEQHPVSSPVSPYAASKIACELLGHVYSHLHGIRFVALRLFTVYGPRQRPDLAIHKFARCLVEGKPLPVFGDGSTRRDYTFVLDIVEGIRQALEYRGSTYEIVNLGNSSPVELRDLIAEMELAFRAKARLEFFPEQPGDLPQTFADTSKAEALLAFRCRTTIPEGLRQFADWYIESLELAPTLS
jgi:UDP-glucuronate 4-epimerase